MPAGAPPKPPGSTLHIFHGSLSAFVEGSVRLAVVQAGPGLLQSNSIHAITSSTDEINRLPA